MERTERLCTKAIILLSSIMIGFTWLLGVGITRYCFFAIMALSVVLFFISGLEKKQMIYLFLICAFSFLDYLIYGGILVNIIIFITSIMLAMYFYRRGISHDNWLFFVFCAHILGITFVLLYFLRPDYNEYGFLRLYFDNPNMAGIVLSSITIVIAISFVEFKNKYLCATSIFLMLFEVYLVYLTNNRGSFLTIIVVVIFATIIKFGKNERKIGRNVVKNILLLMPIIVMIGYVLMMRIFPLDAVFMGKPLFSGRELAWKKAIEDLLSNPFKHHAYHAGTLNLFLEGAKRFGIYSIVTYFVYFSSIKYPSNKYNKTQYVAYYSFFMCMFQQSFESTLITGSFCVYVWIYLLLAIASKGNNK